MKGNGGVYENWKENWYWPVRSVCSAACTADSFFLSHPVDVS